MPPASAATGHARAREYRVNPNVATRRAHIEEYWPTSRYLIVASLFEGVSTTLPAQEFLVVAESAVKSGTRDDMNLCKRGPFQQADAVIKDAADLVTKPEVTIMCNPTKR